MADQLTLELEPGLPRLPASLRPMLARTEARPFDSADHLFEPSWGGERVLAFIEPRRDPAPGPQGRSMHPPADDARTHDLRLLDSRGRDIAPKLPELARLAERVGARSAVLDGEIVVADRAGRPDAASLEGRLSGRSGAAVVYLVFDLLYLDGRPLLGEPLERRRAALAATIVPGPDIVAVPAIKTDGVALHDAVLTQGLAGVMARHRRSPYLPGVRSYLWRFVEASEAHRRSTPEAGSEVGREAPGGSGGNAERRAADAATGGHPASPVLALISRLPFDED